MVIHDPCSARLDPAAQEAVRLAMARIGQELIEPAFSKRLTLCCGFGGLASEASQEMGGLYARERIGEGGPPVLAWCSVCRDRFRALGRSSLHPLDLLFPQEDPATLMALPPPGISDRREGRHRFKARALAEIWGEAPEGEKTMGLNIDIPGSVLRDLESRRILVTDVTDVLENAARNGPTFVNGETGRRIASLRPRQVTFWVEYEQRTDGSILVCRAWCHRMEVPGTAGVGEESPASSEGFAKTGGRV
jgi:hypothetical protein